MEEKIWKLRILEEHYQELYEFKLITLQQLNYKIQKITKTYDRQKITNLQLLEHIKNLDLEINQLNQILNEI